MGDAGGGYQYPDSEDDVMPCFCMMSDPHVVSECPNRTQCTCGPENEVWHDGAMMYEFLPGPDCPEHGENTVRPYWDLWALGIAEAVAKRGDCRRSRVGAVLLDHEHRIVAAGYNGSPPGGPSCLKGECPRGRLSYDQLPAGGDYSNCHAIHAELNCLIDAGRQKRPGSFLYVTREPCDQCVKIAQAAAVEVIIWPTGNKVLV